MRRLIGRHRDELSTASLVISCELPKKSRVYHREPIARTHSSVSQVALPSDATRWSNATCLEEDLMGHFAREVASGKLLKVLPSKRQTPSPALPNQMFPALSSNMQ